MAITTEKDKYIYPTKKIDHRKKKSDYAVHACMENYLQLLKIKIFERIIEIIHKISYLFKKVTFFISIVRFCHGPFWLRSVLVMG